MPELSLYLDGRDEVEFVCFVLSQGNWFVPNLRYKTPQFRVINDLRTFQQLKSETTYFFIQGESFLRSPLQFSTIQKPDEIFYSIRQRYGGPTIDFFCCGEFQKSGEVYIGTASLSHYPTYRNTITGEDEKPPESLRQIYALFVKHLKRNSFRIKPGIRVYWIGKHARELLRQGAKLVGYENVKIEV